MSQMSYSTVQGQLTGMSNIPGQVLSNWPAFFSFSIVNMVGGAVLSMVPDMNGAPGMLLRAATNGAMNVLQFVTWENVKST